MDDVMRGLEKLKRLARRGPEWREKLVSDPLAAAVEAGLDLSERERAVIASMQRTTWERMIEAVEKSQAYQAGEGAVTPPKKPPVEEPIDPEEEVFVTLGISPDIPEPVIEDYPDVEIECTGIRPDEPAELAELDVRIEISNDESAPTIVGPQPSGGARRRRLNTPRGIESLVALARHSSLWRSKVLAEPLLAAQEARLALSDSERKIIGSLPPQTLEKMIDSFNRSRDEPAPPPATPAGIFPDVPPTKRKRGPKS